MCGLQAKPASRQWRPAEVRKITPSATAEPLQAAPARVQALLQPFMSAQQQVLQTAFLDQYSGAEDKARPPLCWLWGMTQACSSVLLGRLVLSAAGWPWDLGRQTGSLLPAVLSAAAARRAWHQTLFKTFCHE